MQEYVHRPDWQTTVEVGRAKKKGATLLEKHKRKFADRKRLARSGNSMVKISIEGSKMGLSQYSSV